MVSSALAEKKNRQYQGAEDEDELRVQEELPTPPLKLHRKTLEHKALESILKNAEAQAPQNADKKK